jgi:hypothetical protein
VPFISTEVSLLRKFIQKSVIPYVDISRLEGKVISYKSLVIEWCQKRRIFHYDIYEDNGIDGTRFFGVKLSIDGKVIAKARATSKKESRRKKHHNAPILHYKKNGQKIISYSSNYIVFVHKLTKSSHFLLSNRNSIFTRLFLSDRQFTN